MAETFPDDSTNTDEIEKNEREELGRRSPSTLNLLLSMQRSLFMRLGERLAVDGLSWRAFAINGIDRQIKDYTMATEEERNTALDNLIQKLKEGAGGR